MFDVFVWDSVNLFQLTIQLLVTLICSGAIGVERELKNRPAGLRTHMVVAATSMLIMHIGVYLSEMSGGVADPARLAAQVVSGIGFLGAGTILRGRSKDEVHGLTTAATLWAVSAVGIAIGAGYIWEAVLSTIIIMIVLAIASRWEKRYSMKRSYEFLLDMLAPVDNLELLMRVLTTNDLILDDHAIQGMDEADGDNIFHLYVRITPKSKKRTRVPKIDTEELLHRFSFIRDVKKITSEVNPYQKTDDGN